ncbi:MAG: NYN domain-containing protein [Limimaricola sp.]|uniref:NYN domain-containing protein n=1 Tax=Limimaricola sp. TaxID=2211665 RepID=UPI001D7D6E48|nr:NYN domain-containing protein [Limimaricola sp.]MBI1416334.1 NYN domain-containing protein [Limimaricola sp.]
MIQVRDLAQRSAQRVAVLVDGDNVAPRYGAQIMAEAERHGRVDIARVYLAANRPSDWLTQPRLRAIHAGHGKNAADILLCIDAMELALTQDIGSFVLASADRDFTHIAQRLRERGLSVLGLGEAKAPEAFRLACSGFTVLQAEAAPPSATVPATAPNPVSDLDRRIRGVIADHSTKGRGMPVALLGQKMHHDHGTRISTMPERNWRTYLANRPTLYDLDPRGPNALVRFRPEGFGGL